MDDTIWLLLWTLVFGFIAGYRYGSGRTATALGYAVGLLGSQPGQTMQGKEIDPVCREAVSADRAKASVHEGRARTGDGEGQ